MHACFLSYQSAIANERIENGHHFNVFIMNLNPTVVSCCFIENNPNPTVLDIFCVSILYLVGMLISSAKLN